MVISSGGERAGMDGKAPGAMETQSREIPSHYAAYHGRVRFLRSALSVEEAGIGAGTASYYLHKSKFYE